MDVNQIKALVKSASNGVLFDAIYYKQFSEEELLFFKDEIKSRGIEGEFRDEIKRKELQKTSLKEGVRRLAEDDLLAIIVYNIHQFTEEELNFFRSEVKERGLEKKMNGLIEKKEADSRRFKVEVEDASHDLTELLTNFNSFNDRQFPEMAARVKKEKRKKSIVNIVLGAVFVLIGGGLTAFSEGGIIFYGAIVVGIVMIVRGVVSLFR